MVLSQIMFVLFGVVVSVSMGGQVCHKTIAKYTPEEFVNDIICNNRFYKQMLFKKVSKGCILTKKINIFSRFVRERTVRFVIPKM